MRFVYVFKSVFESLSVYLIVDKLTIENNGKKYVVDEKCLGIYSKTHRPFSKMAYGAKRRFAVGLLE